MKVRFLGHPVYSPESADICDPRPLASIQTENNNMTVEIRTFFGMSKSASHCYVMFLVLCYILIDEQMLEKALCLNITPSVSSVNHRTDYMG